MANSLLSQRLLALFFAGWALLNFPLLALWNHPVQWFGIPLFPLALFLIWLVLIAALAWIMEVRPD